MSSCRLVAPSRPCHLGRAHLAYLTGHRVAQLAGEAGHKPRLPGGSCAGEQGGRRADNARRAAAKHAALRAERGEGVGVGAGGKACAHREANKLRPVAAGPTVRGSYWVPAQAVVGAPWCTQNVPREGTQLRSCWAHRTPPAGSRFCYALLLFLLQLHLGDLRGGGGGSLQSAARGLAAAPRGAHRRPPLRQPTLATRQPRSCPPSCSPASRI
jgi:hypothetical protein